MYRDMDDYALYRSEVFRNLVRIDEERENQIRIESEKLEKQALEQWEEFQKKVDNSPVLKKEFKKLQAKLINDSEYRKGIDQNFVRGVLLLRLDDEAI